MFDPFGKINVDWMGIRKPLIAISIIVLLAGLVSAVARQAVDGGTDPFNLGVDFKGGTVLTVKFKGEKPNDDQIRAALQAKNLGESDIQASTSTTDEVLIKIPLLEGEEDITKSETKTEPKAENEKEKAGEDEKKSESAENTNSTENADANTESNANNESNTNANTSDDSNTSENANSETNSIANTNSETNKEADAKETESSSGNLNQVSEGRKLVKEALDSFGAEAPAGTSLADAPDARYKIVGSDSVGPVAGEQLRTQAIVATLLGMVGILLFIAFRYDWTYAAGAVIAVFHDVLITLAFFTMFQWEVSLTVVAALLTLVGFSVNDSIVIFDRIRENLAKRRNQSLYDLTNDSINQTMSRTIVTNGLVFLAVLALVLFGGEVLRGFSLALFVGAITGTYSTVAIASPIAIWWQSKLGTAKMKEVIVEEKDKNLASAARRSVKRRPVSK